MLAAIGDDADRARPLVLLVDDCEDTRTLYAEYLDLAGFEVKEAEDGLAALDQAAQTVPDVVVMDLSLPSLNGRDAAARLKADPRTATVPVIVVSGFNREVVEDGEQPWDSYVRKPCLPDDLVAAIRDVLRPHAPT
jgi:two-component system, cell cycle response regulator DivK